MIPFSNSACPRLTPSSGLLISPISVSHDTNSLQRQAEQKQLAFHSEHKQTQASASHQETLLETSVKTVLSHDSSSRWTDFMHFWRKCFAQDLDLLSMTLTTIFPLVHHN